MNHIVGNQAYQEIVNFYRDLDPLYKACLDTNTSVQSINECIVTYGIQAAYNTYCDGMTLLHILALNPHATKGCLLTYFQANMSAAFKRDAMGMTPLDYCLLDDGLDRYTAFMTHLILMLQGK